MSATPHRRRVSRLWMLGGAFLAVCLVYVVIFGIRQLSSENIGGHRKDGTTERTVIVQAMRGQIYDRNGKALVTNEYTYSLTVDYSVLPQDPAQRNEVLIDAAEALYSCGEGGRLETYRYPFEGTFPELVYTAAAQQEGSSEYASLLSVLESTGLRNKTIRQLKAQENMTSKQAEVAYDEAPLSYVTADVLLAYFTDTYQLLDFDPELNQYFYSQTQIDLLLRMYWGMEATGFSRANDYVMAVGISMDTVAYEKELSLPGVGFATSYERVYCYPGYASHILGQTGPIYAEDWEYYKELGYNMNAIVGISGCEAAFESYLHGQDGVKVIVEDADGKVVNEYMKKEPVVGKDVYLTIDIDLQIAAEDGLKENVGYVYHNLGKKDSKAGALTAMDPNTGEVLACASYPTYDLTTFNQDYNRLLSDSALPLTNRALNGLYAPGSTFKPAVTAAALSEGVVTAQTQVECAGVYTYYQSYQPKCWIYNSSTGAQRQHGWITADEALRVSCNCYYYEVGRLLGIDSMNEYCAHLGLGSPTGIELGEATGILAGPTWREATHQKDWMATDTIAAAIGQSDNAFTPMQLSAYISTLVNGGTRYGTHLLYRVCAPSGEVLYATQPEVLDSITLKEAHRQEILYGMEQVITSSSSISTWMRRVPVRVAGKTGTAQVGGNADDNGLFVCCAPSRQPEIVVTSVIERSGGGSYAALAASRVLEAYYK